jgi:hypothetical protein
VSLSEHENKLIHENAVNKGFWDFQVELDRMFKDDELNREEYDELSFIFFGKQFMMIASEVTEAMEAVRKDMGADKIEEEFADIYIRVADLYEGLKSRGIVFNPLTSAIFKKTNINLDRSRLHGVKG